MYDLRSIDVKFGVKHEGSVIGGKRTRSHAGSNQPSTLRGLVESQKTDETRPRGGPRVNVGFQRYIATNTATTFTREILFEDVNLL